ncbi:MAG: hypothetical protein FWF92_09025 [Oscillospiraceae bacterium]|nr:hypothetical protein [Oscillospiraceae bacterium]
MRFTKRNLVILLFTVLFMLSVMIISSCGEKSVGESDSGNNNTGQAQQNQNADNGNDFDAAESEIPVETYEYPEMDGSGADFKFYNVPVDIWFYYTSLVFEESPADVLDDAVHKRNKLIEEKFNINLKEINMPGSDMWTYNQDVRKIIRSDMDEYDAIFMPASFNGTVGAMLADGLFYDMRNISTINLDDEWWNQTMLKEAAIGTKEKIFYAGSGIHLMALQAASCVYFNQDMMATLQLELPYSIVKEGKWTYDVLQEYIKSGANLNGATDFKWEPSGITSYGLVGYEDSSTALLAGSGEQFINSVDGYPVFDPSERFIEVLVKIGDMLNLNNGNYLYANDESTGFHYEPIFMNGRALMTIGELKAANRFRDMDATFGILPIPKFNESQTGYYSHLINQAPVLVIPVTNPRTEFTGAVLDAMAYLSNKDVTPVLFDVSVSQKQLRNEESIDMLQIIKNSGSFEIGMAYGWTNSFYDIIRTKLGEGISMDITSEIEKNSDKITSNIQKTMELFD